MLQRLVLSSCARVRISPRHHCARGIVHTGLCLNEEKNTNGDAEATEANTEPVDETEALKKSVEELTTKNNELNDRLLRALADAENVRRISRHDVQNAREFAISKFAKSLLDVSDNLKRAHESINIEEMHPDHTLEAIKTLHEGVVMTDAQLQKVFREYHIVPVGAVGDKFDPNMHDALFEYEDASKEAGSIGQLMKIGYLINSRCLRPAQVGVVKKTNN